MLRYALMATVFLLPHNLLGWFWYTLLRRGEASRVFPREFAVRLGRDRYFARDAQLRSRTTSLRLALPWSLLNVPAGLNDSVRLRTLLAVKPDRPSDRFDPRDVVLRLWRGWRSVEYDVGVLLFAVWEDSFDDQTLDVVALMHRLTPREESRREEGQAAQT